MCLAPCECQTKIYTLGDTILARIVQIVQEGVLTNTDVSDLMRQIKVTTTENNTLQLTPEYIQQVKDNYQRVIDEYQQNKSNISIIQ